MKKQGVLWIIAVLLFTLIYQIGNLYSLIRHDLEVLEIQGRLERSCDFALTYISQNEDNGANLYTKYSDFYFSNCE